MGIPVVHIGQTGGGRIPDLIGSEGISEAGELFAMARRINAAHGALNVEQKKQAARAEPVFVSPGR